MVFKHNKKPCIDESQQFSYMHSTQVDCGGQLASFVNIPVFMGAPEEPCGSDGGEEILEQTPGETRPMANSITERSVDLEKNFGLSRNIDAVDNHSLCKVNIFNLARVESGVADDAVGPEPSKRPLDGDESHHLACKRARQLDDEDNEIFNLSEGGETITCTTSVELSSYEASKDLKIKEAGHTEDLLGDVSCEILNMSWNTCTHCENVRSELPMQAPSSPEFVEENHKSSGLVISEPLFSFLDYFPRKHVSLGPDHQVDVPLWSPQGFQKSDEEDEVKTGTCVIPLPDSDSQVSSHARVGNDITSCACSDQGSIRCVRQHVAEARKRLKDTLGPVKFEELGFSDMGEDVSLKWSEEEEHVFHDVVFANPASLGKNFWNILPQVFPSRISKELVSYYFNVFMLRKRAEQNRSDPLNVDSDNDEWQGSDDGDYEEDSVVESPIYHENVVYGHEEEEEEQEEHLEEDDEEDACYDFGDANEDNVDISEGFTHYESSSALSGKFVENNSQSVEEHDVQDDSCTSYEGQQSGANFCGGPADMVSGNSITEKVNKKSHEECRNDGLSGSADPGYIVGPCDPKSWDLSYFSRSEKVDFLPTCNVIEEVFGKGTWDTGARDGQGAI